MTTEKTPPCANCQRLQAQLDALPSRFDALLETVAQLQRQLAAARRDSCNSSKPPSSDIVKPPKPSPPPGRQRRKPGGQPGHTSHQRVPQVHCERAPSLRAAIAYANSQSGPETVTFAAAVFAAGRRTIRVIGGPLMLTDPATTTIVGPGSKRLTIRGGAIAPVPRVSAFLPGFSPVTWLESADSGSESLES